MSNILIIKHGSLGDIAQISGVLRDIRETHNEDKIFILTTLPYIELLGRCPYVDGVLIDRRLPRWNLVYLAKLKKLIVKYNFSRVYDLQNSSRTSFYRKFIFKIENWSSTETTLKNEKKNDQLNENSVLERFKLQLSYSGIKVKYCLKPDFTWACVNIDQIINKYFGKKFILIFPFSSPKLAHKQWQHFNDLIKIIKSKHTDFEIVVAPSPSEMDSAATINALIIKNKNKALNINELAGLIKRSSFIIANDTGPAHMAAHLGMKGLVLFGHHTTPKKVSIETEKFKALETKDLDKLTAEFVYSKIKDELILID